MSLLDLVFPRFCLECRAPGRYICQSCLAKVAISGFYSRDDYSIWRYEGVVRKAILALKYRFAKDIAAELSTIATSELKARNFELKNALLVPIPLHARRARWRGFNQSEEIGKILASKMNWEFVPDFLIKNISTRPQATLNRASRLKNVKGVFALNSNLPAVALAKAGHLIIFDDVATTGSTISEAKKALENTQFNRVLSLALAS